MMAARLTTTQRVLDGEHNRDRKARLAALQDGQLAKARQARPSGERDGATGEPRAAWLTVDGPVPPSRTVTVRDHPPDGEPWQAAGGHDTLRTAFEALAAPALAQIAPQAS